MIYEFVDIVIIRENMSILNIEYANGDKKWYLDGKLHREDGPAIEWVNGYKEWWVHGTKHRRDGPAVESVDGYMAWWVHGKLHRNDGPAIMLVSGDKEWWFRDKYYEQLEFLNFLVQHDLKLQMLSRVIPAGAESLVDQYTL